MKTILALLLLTSACTTSDVDPTPAPAPTHRDVVLFAPDDSDSAAATWTLRPSDYAIGSELHVTAVVGLDDASHVLDVALAPGDSLEIAGASVVAWYE